MSRQSRRAGEGEPFVSRSESSPPLPAVMTSTNSTTDTRAVPFRPAVSTEAVHCHGFLPWTPSTERPFVPNSPSPRPSFPTWPLFTRRPYGLTYMNRLLSEGETVDDGKVVTVISERDLLPNMQRCFGPRDVACRRPSII